MEQTANSKKTKKYRTKHVTPEKLLYQMRGFFVSNQFDFNDFCKLSECSQQTISYHLKKLNTSFKELASLFKANPDLCLNVMTELEQNYRTNKTNNIVTTKLVINQESILPKVDHIIESMKNSNSNSDPDPDNQSPKLEVADAKDLNRGDSPKKKTGGGQFEKSTPLNFLKNKQSDGVKIDRKPLLDMAPIHLKDILSGLLDAYDEADAKTKASLFGQIMNYTQKMEQTKGMGELESWRVQKYFRPSNIAPKQIEMIDAMERHIITFIVGDRRARKTSSFYRWDFEHGLDMAHEGKTRSKTIFVAATDANTERIHNDIVGSPYANDIHEFIAHTSRRYTQFNFGHEFIITAPSDKQVKGMDSDVVCFDEVDNLFIDHGKMIADAVATALTNNIKIVFLSNRPKLENVGAFKVFTDMFRSVDYWVNKMNITKEEAETILSQICYMEIGLDEFPENQTEEFKVKHTIVKALQSELVSDDYAESQLGGKEVAGNTSFPANLLIWSMENYQYYITQILRKRSLNTIVMGYDPSGGEHPTGISVWGFLFDPLEERYYIHEIHSEEIKGDLNKDGEYVFQRALEVIITFNVQMVVSESNSGGKRFIWRLQNMGYNADILNIKDGERTMYGHVDFIDTFRNYLYDKALFIKSKDLKTQLSRYSPKTSKGTTYKGDLADAALLAVFKIHEMYGSDVEDLRIERRSSQYNTINESNNNTDMPEPLSNQRPSRSQNDYNKYFYYC